MLRQDVDFGSLFKKLGHHLEEIRHRALENILSKLEHKLICDSDLVQERHLFIRLLEWFNFPKSSRHSEVLNLLVRLSKHSSGAEVIQDVGGIEFLTALRSDISPALQPLIDQILENAMRLPDVQVADHAPECIYQRQDKSGMTTGVEMNIESIVSTKIHDKSAASTNRNITETGTIPDYREPPVGFFDGEAPAQTQYPDMQAQARGQQMLDTSPSSCFRMTIFPWLPLTPTDRHVIVSTNTSLQSRDPSLLVSTCEFLSDVVFQDFLAEIFLQRPNIIKNLMSLLSGPVQDSGNMRIQAIRTLADYASCLHTRIRCHQDPNVYTSKQDFSPSQSNFSTPTSNSSVNNNENGRPSVVGWTEQRPRGDGRDGDSTASSSRASSIGLSPGPESELLDFEDIPSLQYIQMTIPQFCAYILEKALPLLKTSDEILVTEVFHLLNQTLDVIVAIVTPALWEDSSMAARECIEKFTESLDLVADILKYHHHSNVPCDLDDSSDHGSADLVQHRLAYIGISVFVTKFLKMLLPQEKSRGVLPELLLASLNLLMYDECLASSNSDLHAVVLSYVSYLDTGRSDVYNSTDNICKAMHSTCKFLVQCQEEASRMSKDTLTLCKDAFVSLPYHGHMTYITESIKICSDILKQSKISCLGMGYLSFKQQILDCLKCCSKSQHYEQLQQEYRKLLLKFLSHPMTKVRQHTYSTLLQLLKTNLSVAKASEPANTSSDKVKFVVNSDILYEITVFGLADKDTKVGGHASDTMVHLLKSQLLMPPELWYSLIQSVLRCLPVLQSYASLTTVLGTTVLSLMEPKSTSSKNELPTLERFRGTLRCMMSTDLKVRSEALKRLSWYMSNEENSGRKLPLFSELDVTNLSNIFIVDTQRSIEEDLGHSVFQVDGLRKVYEIFTSLSVDPSVKKSAVDQLAIILQDPTLHAAFRKDGGLEKILEHLQLGILRDGDSDTNNYMDYIPGCVTVLRHLVHHDYSLRHKLAHDTNVYHTLVRAALLYCKEDRTCYEVCHTLTLLLFDELARFFVGGNKNTSFSVPVIVKTRYRLPFRPSTHYDKSPFECLMPADPDPLLTETPLETLRLAWNIAWNGGMDNLVSSVSGNRQLKGNDEFSPKLKLTVVDRVVIATSHIKQGLQRSIFDISNATSHYAVSRALHRLQSHLVARYESSLMTVFHTLDWTGALDRFVKVTPSSSADESLLFDILRFISFVLKLTNQVPDNILQWVGEVLYHPKGPLIGLIHRHSTRENPEDISEPVVNLKRSLDKALLTFIAAYNSSLPYILSTRLKFHQLRGDLVQKLLQRLNVTDAPHFYNLASLEGTLQCLMHITARPGWSQECTELEGSSLCVQVLNSLQEVISAFHIGRGGTSMSLMGKGVTKSATLCLRHIVFEMVTQSTEQTWTKHWLYSRHGTDIAEEPGLDWLLTLWTYRDAEVRAAGLGLAVTLSSVEEGRQLLTLNCHHTPGGIWAAAFGILLDHSECSMVRQQAAQILINLTSQQMPSGSGEGDEKTLHGPVVMDTEYQVSLVGLTALLALLHHSQFYREMSLVLSSYYPQPTIQAAVTSDLYKLSESTSENTLSVLADAGLIQKHGSHHNTMSLLQSSAVSSARMSERPGTIGANGQPVIQRTPGSSNRTTPRDAEQGVTDSSAEEQGGNITDNQSVTTPGLVAAVAQLARNLIIQAPQDSVTSLRNESLIPFFISLIDASFLEGIQVLTTSDQLELFFSELVEMHISILKLLQTCLVYDTTTRIELLQDKQSLGGILSLLRIYSDASSDTVEVCCELWESVLSFLTTLIQMHYGPAVEVLAQVLQKQWSPIAENLLKILEGRFESHQLYIDCLNFVSVLCCEEGKLQQKYPEDSTLVTITTLLNTPLQHESKDSSQTTAGSQFCKALITKFDQYILKRSDQSSQTDKVHVSTALRCLLSVSQTAKSTALEMGLAENLLEHGKQLHAKLNLASLQIGKAPTKGKEDPNVSEIILTFDLLRNFTYQNEDVKMACYHSGLQIIVFKMWSWGLIDPSLMISMIQLLTTYTAKCPTATSSLAYTSSTSISQTKSGLSSNSLVHCLIKYISKDGHKEPMLKGLFGLLSNLALSSECRNIIWKSNILREFGDLNPRKPKSAKTKGRQLLMEVLWLDLLLNLSFSLEGQQMILKIPDALDLLLEFIGSSQNQQQRSALLIVRNLCCHSSNKPKILSNDKLLPVLLQSVESGDDKQKTVAASALWAMVFNNQKAKVMMKNSNVFNKLQETLNSVSEREIQLPGKCITDLQAVIHVVSE